MRYCGPDQVHEALRAAWAPLFQRFVDTPPPDPQAFLARYGHHLQQEEMDCSPFKSQEVAEVVRSTNSKAAAGADSWYPADFQWLGELAIDCYTKILNYILQEGEWPDHQRNVHLSIPTSKSP